MKNIIPVVSFSALALLPLTASAQAMLPMGETGRGSVGPDMAAEFTVSLDEPGFLTVVLRAAKGGEEDLVLSVTDAEYQTLPDGRSDMDFGSVLSSEQLVVQIPEAGDYVVIVEVPYGYETVGIEIGGTFLPSDLAAGTPDADGRPSGASAVGIGASVEDAIDPSMGDPWDWFKVTAEAAGVLTVLTRANDMNEGDLKLEIFREGEFREPFDTSDMDQGGTLTNESLNADVAAGETIFVRVSPAFGGGERVSYRFATGLIPGQ